MTKKKQYLIDELKKIGEKYTYDRERAHSEADQLLLAYINDIDVSVAYNNIKKWYA